MARASSVLPVPGGPTSSTPLGMRPPSLVNFFGSFRKAMISSSSSLASSTPATSSKVTLCWFSVRSLARLFPNDIALPPPTCIWRMKKTQTPDQEDHREPVDQQHVPERLRILAARVDPNPLVAEVADQLRIGRCEGTEGLAVGALAVQVLALDRDLGDLTLFDGGEEVAEDHLLVAGRLLGEDVDQQQDDEDEQKPEREIPRKLIHRSITFTHRHNESAQGTIGGTARQSCGFVRSPNEANDPAA